jgi:hypothetical protein
MILIVLLHLLVEFTTLEEGIHPLAGVLRKEIILAKIL